MQFAFNENTDKRVRPTYSGQKATCPLCGGTVIGKCGEIYIRHWQHIHDRNCDPWKEHETPWHREWKAKFPEDMQEIVIEKKGEKHRADIKTFSGVVIEFQHSSISKSTIGIREEFYEDMIWVIDAKPFKDNLRKWSVVQARLRHIDKDSSEQVSFIEQEHKDELTRLSDSIKRNEKEISLKYRSIEYNKNELDNLISDIENINALIKTITDKWEANEGYWESHSADITNDLEYEYSPKLKELFTKVFTLKSELKQCQKTLEEILALENFEVDSKNFKVVSYSSITNQNFDKARAISKDSRKTFFVEVNKIQNESEFQSYKYRQDKFDFAIDPTDVINNLQTKLNQIEQLILETENSIPQLKIEIQTKLFVRLKSKVEKLEAEQTQLHGELDELNTINKNLNSRLSRTQSAQQNNLEESKREIEKEKQERRSKIMKDLKGVYTFHWKHERKSWQDADAPIYFDFGDNFVYEKIREDTFRRMTIQEFIDIHTKTD